VCMCKQFFVKCHMMSCSRVNILCQCTILIITVFWNENYWNILFKIHCCKLIVISVVIIGIKRRCWEWHLIILFLLTLTHSFLLFLMFTSFIISFTISTTVRFGKSLVLLLVQRTLSCEMSTATTVIASSNW
jgi:hypothetical protein